MRIELNPDPLTPKAGTTLLRIKAEGQRENRLRVWTSDTMEARETAKKLYPDAEILEAKAINHPNAPRARGQEYPCTECGGDAFVGLRGWTDPKGNQVIGGHERLCVPCATNRGVPNPLQ